MCSFPEVISRASSLERVIRARHKHIAATIAAAIAPTINYVIDFAATPTAHGWQVSVLELNPFESATSACLFDWAVDGKVLRGQTKPDFEMRVRKTPMAGILARAVPHVRKRLQDWVSDTEAKMARERGRGRGDSTADIGDGPDTSRAKSPMTVSDMNAKMASRDVISCRNCMVKYCALENAFCPTCGSSTAITIQMQARNLI